MRSARRLPKGADKRKERSRPRRWRASARHLKGLRALEKDHPGVGRRIVVWLEPQRLRTDDGIEILLVDDFRDRLWSGSLLQEPAP